MDDDLEARLESHAQAFEGLLSLIPAENYYAKDNSDQWQRKKQTKEEKKAARKAKLDPANQKSALDVMKENEKKRKRELGIESDNEAETEGAPAEGQRPVKKARSGNTSQANEPVPGRSKAEKRKEKRDRQKEKIERQKQKAEVKKARKEEQKQKEQAPSSSTGDAEDDNTEEVEDAAGAGADDIDIIDTTGLVDEQDSSAPASPLLDSPAFDVSANHSATSSSTSIIPPSDASKIQSTGITLDRATTENSDLAAAKSIKSTKQKPLNLPAVDKEQLEAKLRARIEALRQKRKADGPDGQPVRSRQDLLEARRKKSEARKQHKKELRQKAKAEEERLNQERLQGSGSPLSTDIFSPRSEQNNFSFGRVAFEDGATANADLEGLREVKKRKGPQDVKGALQAAEKKQERLRGYDESKRKEIEEKDAWLSAKKRVYGEKVKDDTSLLKKALKRKEKQKGKSEKEWQDRQEGVRKGKEMRQKKREDNLAKRKEEKGSKGKKVKGKPKPKKRGRPGFEGKF
ncbi:surfeit locus protein 6-domain-containing protein [Elsinoe ampelina]|uniref:Surfeit locus protein 6-domain-containing protein n=1 Tax=Elsinoe ampelina TaxID=302913 RepID=A0A6A6GRC0_9PEZI|nr:surfeit locus protein 6-domain-containing protein [Elsinoe ampelina]